MTTTADPNASWQQTIFPTIAIPSLEINVNTIKADFQYGLGEFQYDSILGIKREIYINPTSLLRLIPIKTKAIRAISSFLGNYDVNVSDFTDIKIGNELEFLRSSVSLHTNRSYKWTTARITTGLIVAICLADAALALSVFLGNKLESRTAVVIGAGVNFALVSAAITTMHCMEAFGTEAVSGLKDLQWSLSKEIEKLQFLIKNNSNLPQLVNPMLTKNHIENVIFIASKAAEEATNLVNYSAQDFRAMLEQ